MTKLKVKVNSKSGVALRKCPWFPIVDYAICYIPNETMIVVDENDKCSDHISNNIYVKAILDNGDEGYVVIDALEGFE